MKYFTVTHNAVKCLGEFDCLEDAKATESKWHGSSIYPAVCVDVYDLRTLYLLLTAEIKNLKDTK